MKPRVILVSKQTTYSRLLKEHGDLQNSTMLRRWRESHDRHLQSVDKVAEVIGKEASLFMIEASDTAFITELQDVSMVVTIGGDGTLLSASHHVHGNLPILAVNSDPETSVGFFCACDANGFEEQFKGVSETSYGVSLTRMAVKLNGRQVSNRVLNDVLFCHTNPASTSSYILEELVPGDMPIFTESQKSSGFWIGPAAGSTGARRSAGFEPRPLNEKNLQLCVRELYTRPGFPPGRREIIAEPGHSIHVVSKMDTAAMYIDGDHLAVPVGLGDKLLFEKSNDSLLLTGKPNDVLRQL